MASKVNELVAAQREYVQTMLNTSSNLFKSGASAMEAIGYAHIGWQVIDAPQYTDLPTIESLLANPPQITPVTQKSQEKAPQKATLASLPTVNVPTHPDLKVAAKIDTTTTQPTYDSLNELTGLTPPVMPDIKIEGVDSVEPFADKFDAKLPEVQLPSRPTGVSSFSGSRPSVRTDFPMPQVPAAIASIAAPPELLPLSLPAAPTVQIPSFDAVSPGAAPTPPTGLEATFGSAYNDVINRAIGVITSGVSSLLSANAPDASRVGNKAAGEIERLLGGGTGILPAAENAIYERARAKNRAEAQRLRDNLYADVAGRGFTMPNGALLSGLQSARQAEFDANNTTNNEIIIKQADLEQKNAEFGLQSALTLRTAILQLSGVYTQAMIGVTSQAVDYAKAMLQSAIEVYNAGVRCYEVKLEGYKVEASIYDTRLRAALSAYELFKAQVEAYASQQNAERMKVDVYRAQLDSIGVLAGVYAKQVDAVVQQASLEKLKIEMYAADIQAYSAMVGAKSSEYQGYTAEVQAEISKIGVYGEQVKAFGAQVDSYRAGIDAKKAEMDFKTADARTQLEINNARIQAYRSGVDVQIETNKAIAAINAAKADVFRTDVGAQEAMLRADLATIEQKAEMWKLDLQAQMSTLQVAATANQQLLDQEKTQYLGYTTRVGFQQELMKNEMLYQTMASDKWKTEVGARLQAANFAATKLQLVHQAKLENSRGQLQAHIEAANSIGNFRKNLLEPMMANAAAVGNIAGSAAAGMTTLAAETMTSSG